MGNVHRRARRGLLAAAVALAIAGCGGPTLEEQATSALDRQEDQRSGAKEQAAEPASRPGRQDKPADLGSTASQEAQGGSARESKGSSPSGSETPTLRIGEAKVHVDRRKK